MKKSYFLIVLGILCLFATGCKKDMLSVHSFRLNESGFVDPETKMHLTIGANRSHLSYNAGDNLLVNGHEFTLRQSGSNWFADATDGEDVRAERFYCIYKNVSMGIDGSSSSYNFTNSVTDQIAAGDGVILAGSTEDSLLTLNPACAILRFTAGEAMDYVHVGFSANAVPKTGSITIAADGTPSITPATFLTGVTSDASGEFLQMHTDGSYDEYYVAVPISGSAVRTQLFFKWKKSASPSIYKYKTTGIVTLEKGKIYTLGSTRVSPFDENGATTKLFSVGSGRYVNFSCGNLQMRSKPSPRKWRFAEHQYDCIGSLNSNIDYAYEGFIDLFGWGTSGYNNSNVAYNPYSTSTTNSDYYPGGAYTNSLTGAYVNSDWGYRNSEGDADSRHIYYGDNANTGRWRTLTNEEWDYLLNTRASGTKWGLATIAGTYKGMVILPDSWTDPAGITFVSGKAGQFATNEFTLDEWSAMEYAGAIFLPTTGYRAGTTMYCLNPGAEEGRYWSTTYANENSAYSLRFSKVLFQPANTGARHYGYAVRLVKDYIIPDEK